MKEETRRRRAKRIFSLRQDFKTTDAKTFEEFYLLYKKEYPTVEEKEGGKAQEKEKLLKIISEMFIFDDKVCTPATIIYEKYGGNHYVIGKLIKSIFGKSFLKKQDGKVFRAYHCRLKI